MKFQAQDKEILSTIGIYTLLDLALFLPKTYEDLSLSKVPQIGDCNIEITTKNLKINNGILNISAFCISWQIPIRLVIFNARKWHFGAFGANKMLKISGRVSEFNGTFQITNPKIIKDFGGIIPRYKSDLKDEKIANLIQKYVNYENLKQTGLNDDEINDILSIHKGDKNSVFLLNNIAENEQILASLKFIEIYNYIKKLSSKKTNFPARKIEIYDICNWLNNLPFSPTNDQLQALNDIKSDILSQNASRRVIMGDVGSGKTLIMLGAALLIYPQTAIIMAPTSILSEQIYLEAKKLLPEFVNIILVQKNETNLDLDKANLIIGTHVLLYRNLPQSPLVMIDEQHRFGSMQRQKINELASCGTYRAHFLQFSATPIPRTLSLIQSNFVKFSFLKQIPYQKNIHTIILQNSGFSGLLSHLKDQISKGKQAIIVYPLVEESEKSNYQSLSEAGAFWFERFERVFSTHGKDKQKEQIVAEFAQNGDILLSTTIVEVGISLPRLSTIVVVGAERLGLATLHQLRGRVGRNGGEGWCYIYTKLKEPPQRLKEFAKTLDGFKIADLDLKNRQAGDILDGSVQHGATFNFYEMEEDLALQAQNRLNLHKFD
nr:ATP-dependent DNA helicase RecG [Campylobacter sp.]